MKTYIEWLLDYKSNKPQGTPVSDLSADTREAIERAKSRGLKENSWTDRAFVPKKGSYIELRDWLREWVDDPDILSALTKSNQMYGAYLRQTLKGRK